MWFRSPLIAAAVSLLLLAGCGSDNQALIPQDDADKLTELVSEAGNASADGECDRARRAVREAEQRLSGLPRKTDRRLKANLRDWLDYLEGRIADDCEPPKQEEEETPTPTPTATDTPTPEPTETATPEPTETATPEPTVTVDPGTGGEGLPEEPDGSGGVSPGSQG